MGTVFSREDTFLNSLRKLRRREPSAHGRNGQLSREKSTRDPRDRPGDVPQQTPLAQGERNSRAISPGGLTPSHPILEWEGYLIPRPPARLGHRQQDNPSSSDGFIGENQNSPGSGTSRYSENYLANPFDLPIATVGPQTHHELHRVDSDDQRRKRRRRERRRYLRQNEQRGRKHPGDEESNQQITSGVETNTVATEQSAGGNAFEDELMPLPQRRKIARSGPQSSRFEDTLVGADYEALEQGPARISSSNSIRSSYPLSPVQSIFSSIHQDLHHSRSTLGTGKSWQRSGKRYSHATVTSSKVSITASEATRTKSPASTIRRFFARSRSRSRDRPPLSPSSQYRSTPSLRTGLGNPSIDSNVLDQRLRAINAEGKTRRRSSTSARNSSHIRSSSGGGFVTTSRTSSRASSLIRTPSQVPTPRISSSQVSDEDEDQIQMLLKDMVKLLKKPMDEMKRHPDKRRMQKLSRLADRVYNDIRTVGADAPNAGYAEILTLYMNMKTTFRKNVTYPQEHYLWAQEQIENFTAELDQWFADTKAARSPAANIAAAANGM